jgi:hypothetical protein
MISLFKYDLAGKSQTIRISLVNILLFYLLPGTNIITAYEAVSWKKINFIEQVLSDFGGSIRPEII